MRKWRLGHYRYVRLLQTTVLLSAYQEVLLVKLFLSPSIFRTTYHYAWNFTVKCYAVCVICKQEVVQKANLPFVLYIIQFWGRTLKSFENKHFHLLATVSFRFDWRLEVIIFAIVSFKTLFCLKTFKKLKSSNWKNLSLTSASTQCEF